MSGSKITTEKRRPLLPNTASARLEEVELNLDHAGLTMEPATRKESPQARTKHFVVVGAGLIGASTAYELARKGHKVTLLEAHDKHHNLGSSAGNTRIARAGDEHPEYSTWFEHARRAWSKMDLLKPYPSMSIVKKDSEAYLRIKGNAERNELPYKELSAAQLRARGFRAVPDVYVGITDDGAATIDPESYLDRLYEAIEHMGGDIRFNTTVETWRDCSTKGVTVNHSIHADKIVFATNAFTPQVLERGNASPCVVKDIKDAMNTRRVPLYWFKWPKGVAPTIFRIPKDDGHGNLYAMPEEGSDGHLYLKIGFHGGHGKAASSPDHIERSITTKELRYAAKFLHTVFGNDLIAA